VTDFRELQDKAGRPTQAQFQHFFRLFRDVGLACKDKGDLTDKMVLYKFLYALPPNLKVKGYAAAAKPGKDFDQDHPQAFIKVFKEIELKVNSERDIDALIEEQGMGRPGGSRVKAHRNVFAEPQQASNPVPLPSRPEFATYRDSSPAKEIRDSLQKEELRRKLPSGLEDVTGGMIPTLQKLATAMNPPTNEDLDLITKGLDKLQILHILIERIQDPEIVAEISSLKLYEACQDQVSIQYGEAYDKGKRRGYGGYRTSGGYIKGCKWCGNKKEPGMRPQGYHEYMNQCYDYKKFIGLGVIHESDENNYICIGPWKEGETAYPMVFMDKDGKTRREQVLLRVLNGPYSPDPDRRAQAVKELQEQAEIAALAREKAHTPSVGMIEATWDSDYESDFLEEREHTAETFAMVQNLSTHGDTDSGSDGTVTLGPVETRARKKQHHTGPYDAESKLREKAKEQASYGKPKTTGNVRGKVRFDTTEEILTEDMEVDPPASKTIAPPKVLKKLTPTRADKPVKPSNKEPAVATAPEAKKPRIAKSIKPAPVNPASSLIPKPPTRASSRTPRLQEALIRGNYRLDDVIDKLLAQQQPPGGLSLGEFYVLIERPRLASISRLETIDQRMQRQVSEAKIEALTLLDEEVEEETFLSEKPLLGEGSDHFEDCNAVPWGYPQDKDDNIQPFQPRILRRNSWKRSEERETFDPLSKYIRLAPQWHERVQTHRQIPRPELAKGFRTRQQMWRTQVHKLQENMIADSKLLFLLSAVPVIGLLLVVFLAIAKSYYFKLLSSIYQRPVHSSSGKRTITTGLPSISDLAKAPVARVCLVDAPSSTGTFHSPTPKLVVTIPGNTKVSDVRATLDSGAEVSCMTLNTAARLGLPITRSHNMALKTITGIKSKFAGYADNVAVSVGDLVVRTRFYIMDIPGTKIILGFPFFRQARVSFRYPSDEEGGIVLAQLWNARLQQGTLVQTNFATAEAKDLLALKDEHSIGRIWDEAEYSDSYAEDEFSGNE
jgi:hypothetical protein